MTKPNSSEPKLFGFVSFGLLSALLFAPLPLGSNRPWAISLLAIWLWLWLLVLVAGALVKPATATWLPRLKAAALPLGLLAGFALLVAVQLLPWPHAWRMALLPLSVAPGSDAAGPLSLDAFATRGYLITTLAYLAAFVLVVALGSTQRRVRWMLGTLVASGVLQALIAVVLNWSDARYRYFFYEFVPSSRATGTFPNPDHLAGYMELCLAAGLGLMMAQFTGSTTAPGSWKARSVEAMHFIMSPKMLLRMMLVVMVIALVMTHSRMGNGAFFLAMLLAGGAVAVISPRLRRAALWLVLSMVIVDAVIVGQAVGLERVVERVQGTQIGIATGATGGESVGIEGALPSYREETLVARMRAPAAALTMAQDAPWLGHGGGSFYAAFPAYKTPDVYPTFFTHAHNDYVEVADDTGFLGLALWLGIGLATAWRALRLLRDSEPPLSRGVGVAAAVALFALGLHGLVDFNLHIPANALTFTVLLALVWTTVAPERQRRRTRSSGAD